MERGKKPVEINGGTIWSAVRRALSTHRDRLQEAFLSTSHENESIALDGIARDITDRIVAAHNDG